MKQKIVVKVNICCNKCWKEAKQIVATAEGVTSVTINDKDEIVVLGVGVDSTDLCTALRKKLGRDNANLKSVEEIREQGKNQGGNKPDGNPNPGNKDIKPGGTGKQNVDKEREKAEAVIIHHHYPHPNCNCYQCYIYTTHCQDNPICTIL